MAFVSVRSFRVVGFDWPCCVRIRTAIPLSLMLLFFDLELGLSHAICCRAHEAFFLNTEIGVKRFFADSLQGCIRRPQHSAVDPFLVPDPFAILADHNKILPPAKKRKNPSCFGSFLDMCVCVCAFFLRIAFSYMQRLGRASRNVGRRQSLHPL